MSLIAILYLLFPLLSLALFVRLPARTAVGIVYLAGLIYLPPTDYPVVPPGSFPDWIIGFALPSDLWLTRAWIAPLTALIGSLIFAAPSWQRLRPQPLDLAMLLWCLWPLLQGLLIPGATPSPWRSSLFLIGVWAIPWLLGRVHYRDTDDIWHLLRVLVGVTLPLIPFALWEGIVGPSLYDLLIEPHPYIADGAVRYIGWRPLLFFETGNQYGIWMCSAALAGWAIVQKEAGRLGAERWIIMAFGLSFTALLGQSVGALILLFAALPLLFSPLLRRLAKRLSLPLLGGLVLFAGIYASGVIPVRSWVENSALGRGALEAVQATGRGSIAYRVSQDQKAVPLILEKPIMGAGHWDWWRAADTRPWGLGMLILGQFGLIGIILAGLALCGPLASAVAGSSRDRDLRQARRILVLLVAIAVVDALLNSFVFLPAALMAGALVGKPAKKAKRRAAQASVSD